MNAPQLTPMFQQYLRVKEKHPDALLFFRMGDFYELFFEDAEITARELSIALTARSGGGGSKVPMCGVPHHAAENYLSQLLDKGYKVAICEQVEDPKAAKGLVARAVTRVLTPGTAVDDNSLNAKDENLLAALFWDAKNQTGALAWADYSTGHWTGFSLKSQPGLWQQLLKIGPREILLPDALPTPPEAGELAPRVTNLPMADFDRQRAEKRLLEVQGVADLSVLDLTEQPELTRCLGALLSYLRTTQRTDLGHLEPFRPLAVGQHLGLDEVTERNLELFARLDGKTGPGTLLHVLDHTRTAMGARLLKARLHRPWRTATPIQRAQGGVGIFAAGDTLRSQVRDLLRGVADLERATTRIYLGRSTPKDFVALRDSLGLLPELRQTLTPASQQPAEGLPNTLAETLTHWDDLDDVARLLAKALVDCPPPVITEGGLFRQGYNAELDELLSLTEHGEAKLAELLERERAAHNLPKLKLGYNRVFGYYFELTKSHQGPVPEHFVRRQTLAGAERYVTTALKELEDKLASASERRKSLEYELFNTLRADVAAQRERLTDMARLLAEVDVWQSLAQTARVNTWVRPTLRPDRVLAIKAGRHPVVEAVQGASNFVPSDVRLDDSSRLILITGPNMAGKSTVLRQTAIICLLAQMGSWVPADLADIGLADRIFCRVGASDNLAQGRSTFMVEMTETARILRQATTKSLVLLDEIGRGTSTFDGLALAWAVTEALAGRSSSGVRTLFATHYHELTSLEGRVAGVRNYTVGIKEWKGEIIFLRKLIPGPSDKSYGVEVARLAGVPMSVVDRARTLLAELEAARGDGPRLPPPVQSRLPGMQRPEPPVQEAPEHPALARLRQVNIHDLTPLDALNLLQELKKCAQKD